MSYRGFPFGDALDAAYDESEEARRRFVERYERARAKAEITGLYRPPAHYVGPEKYADQPAPQSRAEMREMIARANHIAKIREQEAEARRRAELADANQLFGPAPAPPPPLSRDELWGEHMAKEQQIAESMRWDAEDERPKSSPRPPFERGTWQPSTSGLAGGFVGVWRRR